MADNANDLRLIAEYAEVKVELDEFKNKAAVRVTLRTKGVWLEQGERPTKYFLSLEEKKSAERTINPRPGGGLSHLRPGGEGGGSK